MLIELIQSKLHKFTVKCISSPFEKHFLMKKHQSLFRRTVFVLLLLFMLGLIALYVFYSPRELIIRLGVRNSFIIAFFISIAGAFTSLTKFSAYPMIIALVGGGLNFFLVGLIAGLGLAIGDILFFLFGHSARDFAGHRYKQKLDKILQRLQRLNSLSVQILIFLYISCTPLPNNLLSGSLAFIKYPFKNVVVPLVLGDVAFCVLVGWLAFMGISLV